LAIKKKYLIEKNNILNEIRANNMTLQELRFFSIYLARINARNVDSRKVRFPVSEFQRILELGRLDMSYFKSVTDSLLCKIVTLIKPSGGYSSFQLFKECTVDTDENGEWYVEIDAHDNALPLMFDFKERYFTYQLWNALRLKSSNQIRMYEVLKQYEKMGSREISVSDLRGLLGINDDEYKRFGDFKSRVLDACQAALESNTDIKFTYEPAGKLGRGGKILRLKFTIEKNEKYKDELALSDFIGTQQLDDSDMEDESTDTFNEMLAFMGEACNNEFNLIEIRVLYDMILKIVPRKIGQNRQTEMYDYLVRKYNELEYQASKREIKRRFGYLRTIVKADFDSQ